MKKYLIFLLFVNITFSQIKSGTVIYNVTPIENESNLDKMYSNLSTNYINKLKLLKFNLIFNENNSNFDLVSEFKNDMSKEKDIACIKIEFTGANYQTKDSLFFEFENELLGNYIIKKPLQNNWTIQNETKTIDGYLCYKAVTEIIRITPAKTFKFPIVAWFCPKINTPFGPFGFGKLPGLILELQTKDAVFGVEKITIDQVPIKEVPKLKKLKIITEEDLKKMNEDLMIEMMKKKDQN